MNNKIVRYMAPDQIRLCKQDACIEARGENAKTIVSVVAFLLFCAGVYYISKIKLTVV
jgi:hypothetical protein